MAGLPLPCTHTAAATETRVRFLGKGTIDVHRKARGDPCSVRLHGDLILSHGSRGVGPSGGLVDEIDQVIRELDSEAKVFDPSVVFRRIDICSKLVHDMLAKALVTSEHGLAAHNWVESLRTPALNMAMAIARCVAHWARLVPGTGLDDLELDIDIIIPQLRVCLVSREPKAPDLAGEKAGPETEAPRILLAPGRKLSRETDELCAICLLNLESEHELLDMEIGDEETVSRLPCSHAFHSRCIRPWFHRALTCPTCRRQVMECFRSVGWASRRRGAHASQRRRRMIYRRS